MFSRPNQLAYRLASFRPPNAESNHSQNSRSSNTTAASNSQVAPNSVTPPPDTSSAAEATPSPPIVAPLLEMGFSLKHVQRAMQITGRLKNRRVLKRLFLVSHPTLTDLRIFTGSAGDMAALTLNQLATWMIEHPCSDLPSSENEGDEAAGVGDGETSGPWVAAVTQAPPAPTTDVPPSVIPSCLTAAGRSYHPKRYQALNRTVKLHICSTYFQIKCLLPPCSLLKCLLTYDPRNLLVMERVKFPFLVFAEAELYAEDSHLTSEVI